MFQEENPNITVSATYDSSGKLQAQIEEGADVDIFMSAAEKQMKALKDGGLMLDDSIRILLVNKVVLISPKNGEKTVASFEDLVSDRVEKIAIGDPSNVPVGQYSEEIFESLGIYDSIKEKLVLGNDVRTVLTWVETGEVDLGIVYATDAYTSDKIDIETEAPEGSHKEVSYPVGIVKASKSQETARKFLEFIYTEEAREVFERYGFDVKVDN